MRASYEASGEENMRADHKAKHGSTKDSPAAGGKAVGGESNLRANQTTKSGSIKSTPGSGGDRRPDGVQTFQDKAV